MSFSQQIPTLAPFEAQRFARRLALFYGAAFALVGTHLPFFPVWLRGIGIDPSWIGIIIAVPSMTRFTVLPLVTAAAERRNALRQALMLTSVLTAAGFAVLGCLTHPLAVMIVYAMTASVWTPMVPMTDGYALKAVARYGLDYGPLRLWGSAAFVVGALGCGWLAQAVAADRLIWALVAVAALGAAASFALPAIEKPAARQRQPSRPAPHLLRDPGFLTIIAASALIQGSHAAYYTFASITWQGEGYGGLTIACLWVLGVLAEIVVFGLSPRFSWPPSTLVIISGLCAVVRWLSTALSPPLPVLALIQTVHGLSFGLTMVATMALLVRHVPQERMARAQGFMAAATGLVMSSTSVVSGSLYARFGHGIYAVMAVLALTGVCVMAVGRRRAGKPPGD